MFYLSVFLALLVASTSACARPTRLSQTSQRPVTMQDLSVPRERLPAGCSLEPPPPPGVGGSWGGLGTTSNPWMGTDRRIVASVRASVDGPRLLPDGPPPTTRLVRRSFSGLADGVEEAYAAFYEQLGVKGIEEIGVYAFRLSVGERPDVMRRSLQAGTRIELGRTVAALRGPDGPCFQAIQTHLRSLVK